MNEDFIEWSKSYQSLTEFVAGFGRFLRSKGFSISADVLSDSLIAIHFSSAHKSLNTLNEVLKIVLSKSEAQASQFDEFFNEYWLDRKRASNSKEAKKKKPSKNKNQSGSQNSLDALKSWLYNEPAQDEKQTSTYSTHHSFESTAFVDFTDDELEQVFEYIRRMGRTWAFHYSRRNQNAAKGKIDIRQLIRTNMASGAELIHLAFQKPKRSKLKLVILCDVSRSMQLYSQFFIQFALSFQSIFKKVQTFVFATQLHELKNNIEIPEFGSGTNIGGSLSSFVEGHLKSKVNKNTIVLIMSDGWDVAESGLVGENMRKISKSCRKVVWLNPLMAHPEFKPETEALREALPYIDKMLPVHNAMSLRSVVKELMV